VPCDFVPLKANLLILTIRTCRGLRSGGPLKGIEYFIQSIFFLLLLRGQRKILLVIYSWFRKIDDVMDEEDCPPKGHTIDSYIFQKQSVLNGDDSILLPEDILFIYFHRLCKKYDVDISKEINDLFSAMIFERDHKYMFIPEKDIFRNRAKQDKAVFISSIKILGGDAKFFDEDFPYWGSFSRLDSLADINEDIKKGIVNISLEDAQRFGISLESLLLSEDLKDIPGFNAWYKEESVKVKKDYEETIAYLENNQGSFIPGFIFFKIGKVIKITFKKYYGVN
jgi:hypothetical protein